MCVYPRSRIWIDPRSRIWAELQWAIWVDPQSENVGRHTITNLGRPTITNFGGLTVKDFLKEFSTKKAFECLMTCEQENHNIIFIFTFFKYFHFSPKYTYIICPSKYHLWDMSSVDILQPNICEIHKRIFSMALWSSCAANCFTFTNIAFVGQSSFYCFWKGNQPKILSAKKIIKLILKEQTSCFMCHVFSWFPPNLCVSHSLLSSADSKPANHLHNRTVTYCPYWFQYIRWVSNSPNILSSLCVR